jgi:cell division protein FtsQ
VQINFIEDNHHEFITKSEVNSILSSMGIVEKVTLKHEINFSQIERKLLNHSAINSAEVYFNNNGNLVVYIRKRTPIARFVSPVFEKNFYVDDNGYLMPICSTYVSRVPVFSGKINIPDALNFYDLDSLHKSLDFQKIYKMSKLINNDSFLKSQIVQIYINNNGYFELIPRIGNQRILFGSTENMEKKFKKIKLFYKNGPQPKDLNKYDTLNLIYENQIICSKRN